MKKFEEAELTVERFEDEVIVTSGCTENCSIVCYNYCRDVCTVDMCETYRP